MSESTFGFSFGVAQDVRAEIRGAQAGPLFRGGHDRRYLSSCEESLERVDELRRIARSRRGLLPLVTHTLRRTGQV
jgi:hypothetical protein